MNKAELVKAIQNKFELTGKVSNELVSYVFDEVIEAAKKDGRVQVCGLVFKKVERPARTGRNPRTGEALKIEAKSYIKMSKRI